MEYININGKISSIDNVHLPVDNGAFRYGYGLFETMLIQNGAIQHKDNHLIRLFAGIHVLQLESPGHLKPEWLADQVLLTVKRNNAETLCRVRLQLFAGSGGLYGPEIAKTGFIIECFELDERILQLNENGLVAGIAEGLNKSIDSLSNLKTCNALLYAIAARQARNNKWNDALIRNTTGNIIESTIGNIFWVKRGIVHTPPLSEGCIAGVMRQYISAQLPDAVAKTLTVTELMDADEVFLTNSIRRIKWIGSIDGKRYTNSQTKLIFQKCFG